MSYGNGRTITSGVAAGGGAGAFQIFPPNAGSTEIPTVSSALTSHEQVIGALADAINEIESRLCTAVRHEPATTNDAANSPTPVSVSVRDRIERASQHLDALIYRLRDLTRRIEL